MALDSKNIMVRSISGLVYIGLIVGAILWGGIGMAILASFFVVTACYELEKNALSDDSPGFEKFVDYASLVVMIWAVALVDNSFYFYALSIAWVLLIGFRFILQIFVPQRHPLKAISVSLFSQFYIGVPLAILVVATSILNPWVLICAIAMIWINDSGAYLIGTAFGRHKLIPRLSPHKSWEGFIGGLLFNIGFAFIYYYCFKLNDYPLISNVQGWIFIGICVSVLATLGDLFESLLKRSLGIKDFGNLIPGHGGILDRIDAMLFVVPGLAIALNIAYLFLF